MPDIDTYLAKIKTAVYGEDVRDSIHDAIEEINNIADASNPVNLMSSIASTYDTVDTSKVYNVGDYALRADGSGRLYLCQTATTGGVDFIGTNWIQQSIASILANYVEVNQFRFDSTNGQVVILEGKSCDDLLTANVWYVNYLNGASVLMDFPIDGAGWLRVTATGNRVIQQVYPSDPETFPYRLYRTRDVKDGNYVWSRWYKMLMEPL